MRRILLLTTDLEIGGTPAVVRELALRLMAARGAHIEVACLSTWGPVADEIAATNIRVTAFDARSVFMLPRVVLRLTRLIRARQIDTVFSFLIHANMVAALARPLCRKVRWLQSIQTTQRYPRWHWALQSIAQLAAEHVVVPSHSVAAVARRWAGVPTEKLIVIPNAVDLADFKAQSIPDVQRQRTQVGFIGRLDPIKHIGDLIEAMQFLNPATHLHIFGQGDERPRLEKQIAELRLSHRVTLQGAVRGPGQALAAMDVLVLPSAAEGFGLVLIEAMAAGVAVVATDIPGICDVVKNGETGLLVPVASPEKLAAAIATLLNDPEEYAALTARARRDVCQRFSWETVLPLYQELLETV